MIQHLSIEMDGNRRWAQKNKLQPWIGHRKGVDAIKTVVEFCLEHKIPHLSLYTFSLENFKRPEREKQFLFELIIEQTDKVLPDLLKNNVRVTFIGDRQLFPEMVRNSIFKIETATKVNNALNVYFMFCYGSRQEIVSATQKIASDVLAGNLSISEITPELFKNYLWTTGIPDPDILIRPSGYIRLSNFLLYQVAYTELFFTDLLWPEITKQYLEQVISEFKNRQRNFGA